MSGSIKYSIVIPVYNEEKSIEILYDQLKPVLKKLNDFYEIIFVDDGSKDSTFDKLTKITKKDSQVKVISFRKNHGQSTALMAGFDFSSGDVIISMDGDLQNDPRDIPSLIKELEKGYDVVCGWRKERKDPYFRKKIPSSISNWTASKLYNLEIHDFGCTFRAYKRSVVENILIYGEMHRYLPAIVASKGYSINEIEVSHNPRNLGESKYNVKRLIKGLLDLLSMYIIERYFNRPIHFFGILGLLSISIGLILGVYLSFIRIFFNTPIADRPLLLLSVLMMIFGAQFLVLGLIGEMLSRIRLESKKDALYDIKKKINFEL